MSDKRIAGYPSTEVSLQSIQIDASYQRGREERHVARIAKTFDQDQFRPPLCVRRTDDSLFCIDGQQRVLGARDAGYTHVWATVIPSEGVEREAWLFVLANEGTQKVDAQFKHKARLVWGEPVALKIEKVLNSYGLTGTPNGSHEVRAITALRNCWTNPDNPKPGDLVAGGACLEWVVGALAGQYGDGARRSRDVYQADPINALAWLYRNAPDNPPLHEVVTKLAEVGPGYLHEVITGHKWSTGGSLSQAYGLNLGRWLGWAWVQEKLSQLGKKAA